MAWSAWGRFRRWGLPVIMALRDRPTDSISSGHSRRTFRANRNLTSGSASRRRYEHLHPRAQVATAITGTVSPATSRNWCCHQATAVTRRCKRCADLVAPPQPARAANPPTDLPASYAQKLPGSPSPAADHGSAQPTIGSSRAHRIMPVESVAIAVRVWLSPA